jgi:hypothetical protein
MVVDTLACHRSRRWVSASASRRSPPRPSSRATGCCSTPDGVTEGRNLAGEPFGEARLADLLVRATLAGQPAAETMRRLAHAILAHQGRAPRDDATMVFLEWPGPPGEFDRAGSKDAQH